MTQQKNKSDLIRAIIKKSGKKGELVFDILEDKTEQYLDKLLKAMKLL
jgi:hypothetical protein